MIIDLQEAVAQEFSDLSRHVDIHSWDIVIQNSEDIMLWPDGEWCFREDENDMQWKSDDYRIVPFDSVAWHDLMTRAYA